MASGRFSRNSQGDDLDTNAFFRCLQTVFRGKFNEAQKKCWIICIPTSQSIKSHKITGHFIDCHIFKPSPYFKSQYVSTDRAESKAIEIDGNSIRLVTEHSRDYKVKILSEELSYNQNYQPFKMYIVEKPLDLLYQAKKASQEKVIKASNLTFEDCSRFLRSFDCHSSTMKDLDRKLSLFNKNYIFLPDYLHDSAERLKEIINWASLALLDSHEEDSMEYDSSDIRTAVERYVVAQLHSKLFNVIREKMAREDKGLSNLLQDLHSLELTPDQLGVQSSFCCPLNTAVVELASLNSKNSPAEKLDCLKTTLELIPEDIYNALNDVESPFKRLTDIPVISSDDLIPLVISILVQARPQHLESNLFYIQNFTWNDSFRDKQSFCLVTFQAAKEFIKSHDFSHLKPSKNRIKKEMSLEELMEVTSKIQWDMKSGNDKSGASGSQAERATSPIDRHLHRITKMIENSTREFRSQEEQPVHSARRTPQDIAKENGRDNLGDFLSSLQQNCLGVSYGKQT